MSESNDAWVSAGAWRLGGDRRFEFHHAGGAIEVTGRRVAGTLDRWKIERGGISEEARLTVAAADRLVVETDGEAVTCRVSRSGNSITVALDGDSHEFTLAHRREQHAHVEGHRGKGLVAPMPGLVLRVQVREGDRVRTHQTLVVIEAMKMEHAIEAPHDGVVKKVHCVEGGRVTEGQLLVELEEAVAE
jgi:acetyl/propionyl-CoA carboxylase alpha subunit